MRRVTSKRWAVALLTAVSLAVPLAAGLGVAPMAYAAGSASDGGVTISVAVASSTGNLSALKHGDPLIYTVSIDCGAVSSCGAATLTITLPPGVEFPGQTLPSGIVLSAPPGATITVTGATPYPYVTLQWADLTTTSFDVPASVGRLASYLLNGPATATFHLTTASGGTSGPTDLTADAMVTLAIPATYFYISVSFPTIPSPAWLINYDQVVDVGYMCTGDTTETIVPVTIWNHYISWRVAVDGIPLGSTCQLTSETWYPNGQTLPGYGRATPDGGAGNPPGYTAVWSQPITVNGSNELSVANTLNTSSLTLKQTVSGAAVPALGADSFSFAWAFSCSMPAPDGSLIHLVISPPNFGTKANGAAVTTAGLPVGATCTYLQYAAEDDARVGAVHSVVVNEGASTIVEPEDLDGNGMTFYWPVVVGPLPATLTDVVFNVNFDISNFTITKTLSNPSNAPVGDMSFIVDSCTYSNDGGYASPVQLDSTMITSVSFTAAQAMVPGGATKTFTGLPVGAVCLVRETDDGAVAHPDPEATQGKDVTVAADGSASVSFSNTQDGYSLTLNAVTTGGNVVLLPKSFPMSVSCTVRGEQVITWSGNVAVGTPTVIEGIPYAAYCQASENDTKQALSTTAAITGGMNPSINGINAEWLTIADASLTYTNNYDTAYVTVAVHINQVMAGASPAGAKLPYTVSATYIDEAGQLQPFPLPDGGAYLLGGGSSVNMVLPLGVTVTITQTDQMGSTVTTTKDGATISQAAISFSIAGSDVNTEITVTFTNTWTTASTGGQLVGGDLPGAALGLMLCLTGVAVLRRRARVTG